MSFFKKKNNPNLIPVKKIVYDSSKSKSFERTYYIKSYDIHYTTDLKELSTNVLKPFYDDIKNGNKKLFYLLEKYDYISGKDYVNIGLPIGIFFIFKYPYHETALTLWTDSSTFSSLNKTKIHRKSN
jgi:hypothetical protein